MLSVTATMQYTVRAPKLCPRIPKADRKTVSNTHNRNYPTTSINTALMIQRTETWAPGHESLPWCSSVRPFLFFPHWPGGLGWISSVFLGWGERALDCLGEGSPEYLDLVHLWPRWHTPCLQMAKVGNTRRWPCQQNPFTSVSHDNCWPSTGNTRTLDPPYVWLILFWKSCLPMKSP